MVSCVLAQHARRGWGWRPAAGGRLRHRAWSPSTMAKTVAYFYDPDVGNFHYGRAQGCAEREVLREGLQV